MATATTTKAAQRKTYKGKYPGPDKYKGDPKKLAKYRADKKKTSAATDEGAAAPAQADTTLPTQNYVAPAPTNAAANANGMLDLQTNYDFNMQADQANADYADALAQATLDRSNNLIQETTDKNQLESDTKVAAGRNAGNLAARGMTGDVAVAKQTELTDEVARNSGNITNNAKSAEDAVVARLTSAESRKNTTLGRITQGKQDFTNAQSRVNPTEGSLPEDSGVAPTDVSAANPAAPVAPAAATAAAARKWKGQYRGPDKYKGDEKKLAAWRKAGRPKVK